MYKKMINHNQSGFTIVEVLISSIIIAILSISLFNAYIVFNSAQVYARYKTIGTELASNQIEYFKSLPYDELAIDGGAIIHPNPLPQQESQVLDGTTYTITSNINYVDDAFDGCGDYPDEATKNLACFNLPSPGGAPSLDTNPADYKIVNVRVHVNNKQVASLDTHIGARVAETESITGALVVKVIDASGNPVSNALINVTNSSLTPLINIGDNTDNNGVAIFYGLPPDTGNDYKVTAQKSNYSTLTTIVPTGSLSPNHANQNIITQQSSSVTMVINPMGEYSLVIESADVNNNPLPNVSVAIKGGTKKYSDTDNNEYYYNNTIPSDIRPSTGGSATVSVKNLEPGRYVFCDDNGAGDCNDASGKYLVAAIPYGAESSVGSIYVPSYDSAAPPSVLFNHDGNAYYQKVRLFFTSNSSHPRIHEIRNVTASKAAGTFTFTIKGSNLPCDNTSPSLCATTVTVKNSGGDMAAACINVDSTANLLDCTINLATANVEQSNITLSANGYTINIPNGTGLLGGINVTP